MATNFAQSPFNSTTLPNAIMTTTTSSETPNVYDHQGAALYIAVILVWYSTGLAMMLFLQVRPRSLQQQFLLDSSYSSSARKTTSSTTNPFAYYRNVQADNTTKQILNELKDPERRKRLWKIYYASAEQQHQHHPQYYQTVTSDTATIHRIQRKLDDIHRMNTRDDDDYPPPHSSVVPPTNENPSVPAYDSSSFFAKRFSLLRRSAGMSNTRPTLVRTQSQNDTTTPTITTVEMHPLVSNTTTTSAVRKKDNSPTRFKIEKVPESIPIVATTKENMS